MAVNSRSGCLGPPRRGGGGAFRARGPWLALALLPALWLCGCNGRAARPGGAGGDGRTADSTGGGTAAGGAASGGTETGGTATGGRAGGSVAPGGADPGSTAAGGKSAAGAPPKAGDERRAPPNALADLEKSLRSAAEPPPGTQAALRQALLAEAEEAVTAWVKEIDAENGAAARNVLVSEEDLEAIAMEGLRTILGASLLPQNQKNLESLLEYGRGRKVQIDLWTADRLNHTQAGNLYSRRLPMLREGRLELLIDNQPFVLGLDLLSIDGQWKVFKLEMKE